MIVGQPCLFGFCVGGLCHFSRFCYAVNVHITPMAG